MDSRELTGWERGKGKSAELFCRVRQRGGVAGNTCGTVCMNDAGALSAYRNGTPWA